MIGRQSTSGTAFNQRPRQRGRASAVVALALGGLLAAPVLAFVAPSEAATRQEILFQQFSSCPKFMAYVKALTLPTVGPYGLNSAGVVGVPRTTGGTKTTKKTAAPASAAPAADRGIAAPAAAPAPATPVSAEAVSASAAANSSSTNTQEVGVDEGDLIENDGRYLYSGAGGSVRIVDTTSGKLVATIPGDAGSEPQLLLDGPRLAIIRQLYNAWPETVVERWDVSDPTSPRFFSRVHFEGTLVASRTVDHRARIVLQTPFGARLSFVNPADGTDRAVKAATAANRSIIQKSKVDDWLPRAFNSDEQRNATTLRQAVNCVEIGKPADTAGLGLTWVATLDLNVASPRTGSSGSGGVVGDANIVYASDRTLYVATTTPSSVVTGGPIALPAIQPIVAPGSFGGTAVRPGKAAPTRTLLHAFDLAGPDGATYLASGKVDGRLLNQFSLSEFGGVLRAAVTTDGTGFGSPQQSGIRVLARDGRTLSQIGSLNGLGINERIYAVRFLGELGYVVTFRQVDPLYVIDLRDPRAPRRAGELKIPGYSSYLHPIGTGQLLGIGQDATDSGQRLGTALQVFDVSDPNNPKQTAKLRVGGQSEAEYDHRAFLWWGPTANAVIPQTSFDRGVYKPGAVVAKVTATAITAQGRIDHALPQRPAPTFVPTTVAGGIAAPAILPIPQIPTEAIRRSAIVNGRLVTVSPNAVKVTELASLGQIFYSTFLDQ